MIAIEAAGAFPAAIDASPLPPSHRPFGDQREQAEQDERADQLGRKNVGGTVDRRELGAGVHIDDGAGQNSDQADEGQGQAAPRSEERSGGKEGGSQGGLQGS